MRRILSFVACCLILCCAPATLHAQTREPYKLKHEVTVRWGLYDDPDDYYRSWGWSDESPLERYNRGKYYLDDRLNTQAISVSYGHEIKKWLALSIHLSYAGAMQNERLASDDRIVNKHRLHRFAVFPTVKFTYLNRPFVRLYSAVGFGFGWKRAKWDTHSTYYINETRVSGQLTCFGVSVGKDLFASWEIGYGSLGFVTLGGGYRF
jgi:hypothetical protein